MPKYQVRSAFLGVHEYIEFEDNLSPRQAKERWLDSSEEKIGGATKELLRRYVTVERLDDNDSGDPSELE